MSSNGFKFSSDHTDTTDSSLPPWKILIVDDDEGVHDITKLSLKNIVVKERRLAFTSAYSGKEAREILEKDNDFHVILLDVVMETQHAGLELVEYIRHKLLNPDVRIIIRTGQSGVAPEEHVIDHYDINDYKEKTELTSGRLYISVKLALMNYNDIQMSKIEKKKISEEIQHHPLTHLKNRYKLESDLITRDKKTLILLNLDHFSHINDLYGYEYGNYVIKEVARILSLLEKTGENSLYHLGIDEFLLICHNPSSNNVNNLITLIQQKFHNNQFIIDDIELDITFTIGIVEDEEDNLLNKANLAIKEARLISPNRVQRYSKDMKVIKDIEDNLYWHKKVKQALKEDRIVPYFQPIFNNKTKKTEKYECLVRMLDNGEVISPFFFLNVAKETGLLTQITYTMLEKSAQVFANNELTFCINITNHDLQDENFSSFVHTTLERYKIIPSRVVFEILESNSLDQIPNSRKNIAALQALGCKVALDDFGAECQNFSNILHLNLDSIKIDGAFIKNLKDEMSYKMVDSIVYFANNVGIELVAEFVCDKEIFDLVNQFGIKYSQGFYISKPLPTLPEEESI